MLLNEIGLAGYFVSEVELDELRDYYLDNEFGIVIDRRLAVFGEAVVDDLSYVNHFYDYVYGVVRNGDNIGSVPDSYVYRMTRLVEELWDRFGHDEFADVDRMIVCFERADESEFRVGFDLGEDVSEELSEKYQRIVGLSWVNVLDTVEVIVGMLPEINERFGWVR